MIHISDTNFQRNFADLTPSSLIPFFKKSFVGHLTNFTRLHLAFFGFKKCVACRVSYALDTREKSLPKVVEVEKEGRSNLLE